MWIQNVSKFDIIARDYKPPGPNSMLIQILDPDEEFPTPPPEFAEVYQFEFLDIEGTGYTNLGDGELTDMSEFAITPEQGEQIAELLLRARDKKMNVVVHCYAGIFRSGAVAEIGVMLGFEDIRAFRCPNRLVKHTIMDALGMKYNPKEPMTINGEPSSASRNTIMFKGYRSQIDKKSEK